MNELKIFNSPIFGDVRVAELNGEPIFCLADLCRVLELTPKGIKQRLQDEVISNYPIIDSLGREQIALFVNEDGMYDVVLDSRKPEAKKFRKWVTSEVLPSIRKNGVYATDVTIEHMLSDPDFAIGLLNKLKEEKESRIEAQNKVAILTHTNKTYTATEIAKEFGLRSANMLNKFLHDNGIQYSQNDTWVPYSKYAQMGLFEIKQEVLDNGHIIYHRKITGIGRDFISSLINK